MNTLYKFDTEIILRYGGHDVGGGWLIRVLRGILGILILLGVFIGTEKMPRSEEALLLYGIGQYIRHVFLIFSGLFLFPYGFTKLKLVRSMEVL